MAITHLPATPVPASTGPSTRTVVTALIGGTALLKAGGFAWNFLGYYISDGAGHGTTAAGTGLTLFGIGWCIGQACSGALTDRLGQRTALTILMAVSALACFALALTRSLPALMAVSVLLGFSMEVHRPAVSAQINDTISSEAGRTRAQGWIYWSMNVGIAVCGGLGGFLAHHYGYQALFIANGIVCVAFALIARRVLTPRPHAATVPVMVTYRQVLSDPSLRWISVAAVGTMICAYGLVSVLPLLMASDLPPTTYGVAMIANAVAVLVLSPPLMRFLVGSNEQMRFPLVSVLAAGSLILGAGMAFAALQHTLPGYATAAVLIVPGEICYSVAVGAYISKAAPAGATGRYQAVLSGASAVASLPPLGIALALELGGRPLVAALLSASGVTAAAACLPLARALRSRGTGRPTRAPAPNPGPGPHGSGLRS
ncbi:MFS transporter [Streptomyces tirandamycinicus]|uniref:MFS transporter n=1 Tax=Streptomyces tirandamycinicus TaxID=2174846 RepID=UPI0034296B0B